MNFDKAAKFTGIDDGLLNIIKSCNSLLRVNFPLRRDDGSVEVRGAGQARRMRGFKQMPGATRLYSFLWLLLLSLTCGCNRAVYCALLSHRSSL